MGNILWNVRPGPQRESVCVGGGGGGSTKHAYKNKQTQINDAYYYLHYYYYSKYILGMLDGLWKTIIVKNVVSKRYKNQSNL